MKTPVRGPLGIDRVGIDRLRMLRVGIHRAVASAVWFVVATTAIGAAQAAAPGIAVQGNQFVTTSAGTLGVISVGANVPVVLRGVNITGSEYECLQGDSVWDSSSQPNAETTAEYQKVVNAILAWHANVVRIPLNEDCWLDEPSSSPPPAATSGPVNYADVIASFISVANASGLIAEVDLHVGAGPELVKKNSNNIDSFPAMDTNYSLAFWQSVASKFAGSPSVIFNLTNEPEFLSSTSNWSCYLSGGCSTKGLPSPNGSANYWTVQGTQSVVTAIRNTGAKNPIIIAGLDYSNQLNDWLSYVPSDPDGQIIAGIHIYFDDLDCEDAACWTSVFGGIQAAGYPIVVDETGELDKVKNTPATGDTGCGSGSEQTLTAWADAQSPQVGYWFWAFTSADWKNCTNGPDLLQGPNPPTSFTAWPNYGTFVESHLQLVQ